MSPAYFFSGIILILSAFSTLSKAQNVSGSRSDSSEKIALIPAAFQGLHIGGYIQPQWLKAQSPGIASYSGGNFPSRTDNRFSIRRGRLGAEYLLKDASGFARLDVALQIDVSENGVGIRDCRASLFESKWHVLSFSAGMFRKPFGYEVTYSSSRRETPERGRASQILMRGERDLGIMLSFSPQDKNAKLAWLHADLALMNGPGISANGDYDSHKDLIARVWTNPWSFFQKKFSLTGGLSWYEGGIINPTVMVYHYEQGHYLIEAVAENNGKLMPRRYYGADIQLKLGRERFKTELRAEYLRGKQTGSIGSSETPLSIAPPVVLATRNFEASYFYFLQQLGSLRQQVVLKYDFYDPDTDVSGMGVDASNGFTAADVRFQTWGIGYVWDYSDAIRLMLYYDHPINENTRLSGYAQDLADDVFTARLQFRF